MTQQALSVRFGFPTETSIPFVGVSLSAGDIVVTLDTGDYVTLSAMTEFGTDSGNGSKPRCGYTENSSFTGLEPFRKYQWTATQGGNSITGSFWTAPSDTDDFCLYFGTCEQNNASYTTTAASLIKKYVNSPGSLPCVGLMHADDHGYWDFINPAGSPEYTYENVGPSSKTSQFDFGISAVSCLGLYDGDSYADYGQNEDRLWGIRNLSLIPQWGDHDCGLNEMGWGPITNDANPATSPRYAASTAIWNLLMGPLQPPLVTGAAANGDNSWLGSIGCVDIIAPDGISKGSGDGVTPANLAGPTTLWGNTLIDNMLTAVAESQNKITLMLMNYSIKFMAAGQTQGNQALAQNPLKDLMLTEYQRMFTATGNTPKSLMDNPKTNGQSGLLALLHGDNHTASIVNHRSVAYTGNAAESFCEISGCGFNKGGGATLAQCVEGYEYDGSVVEYSEINWVADDFPEAYTCRVEVYGSKSNKEVHFVYLGLKDGVEQELRRKKLVLGRSANHPVDVDVDLTLDTSSGGAPAGSGI